VIKLKISALIARHITSDISLLVGKKILTAKIDFTVWAIARLD